MKLLRVLAIFMGIFFGATEFLLAQKTIITPGDTIERVSTMEDLETLTVFLHSLSSSTVVFKWQKLSESLPADWEATVCDNKICYTRLEDSGTMNPVDSSESAFLLLHITSHVNYGTATVRYVVWDAQYPLLTDTLTYIVRVEPFTGIKEGDKAATACVYPNPANRHFHIQTNESAIFEYQIADIRGRIMEYGTCSTGSLTLNIRGYRTGLYFVSIHRSKQPIQTFKIIINQEL